MRGAMSSRVIYDPSNESVIVVVSATFKELNINRGAILVFHEVIEFERISRGSIYDSYTLQKGLLFEKIDQDKDGVDDFKLFALGYLENDFFQIRAKNYEIVSKNFDVR